MIVVMKKGSAASAIAEVVSRVKEDSYTPHISEGDERTIIGLVGESLTPLREDDYSIMDSVERVMRVSAPYKLASRDFHPNDTLVALNGSHAGGKKVIVIAGPCSVETREQTIEIACAVKEMGATALRC